MKKTKILTMICFLFTWGVVVGAAVLAIYAKDVMEWYVDVTGRPAEIIVSVLRTFYICCPAGFLALGLLLRLLWNVMKERVFTMGSVNLLRGVACCALLDGILCAVFGWKYLPFLLVTVVAIFVALLLFVLVRVLRTAVFIKNENELTI